MRTSRLSRHIGGLLLAWGTLHAGAWAQPASGPDTHPAAAATFAHGLGAFERGELSQARRLWKVLAEGGHIAAAFNLGVMMERGWGGDADLAQAARWYETAALAGDLQAQWALAQLHARGAEGVSRVEEARRWLRLITERRVDGEEGREIQAQARVLLDQLPAPVMEEIRFEGGRYVFMESVAERCIIALQGRINQAASWTFPDVVKRARVKGCRQPFILLESGGGLVADGLALGRAIRAEGFSTVVRDRCASACGLIFMGGSERILVGSRARIGLHQASTTDPENKRAAKRCSVDPQSGVYRNIRNYLREVIDDTQDTVLQRTLQTACTSMDWVQGQEAVGLRIATSLQ